MDLFDKSNLSQPNLGELSQHIDTLVLACRRLKEENISLKQRQHQLVTERAALIEKNEQARSRVEAMIHRLKLMEEK